MRTRVGRSQRRWILAALVALIPFSSPATTCEGLTALALGNAVVSSASPASASGNLPAYCNVKAVAKPVDDSEIHIEIWLPAAQIWNGKFLGTGNGGYSGAINENPQLIQSRL